MLARAVADYGLVFCRVAGCFLMLPILSGLHTPPRYRLLLALGLSVAIAGAVARSQSEMPDLSAFVAESGFGIVLGLLVRLVFLAFEAALNLVANAIGLTMSLGPTIESGDPQPPLTALTMLCASALFVFADLHLVLFEALAHSFADVPTVKPGLANGVLADGVLAAVVDVVSSALIGALRLAMPLVVFSLAVNIALAFANRAAPQIAAYFLAAPLVIAGGIAIYAAVAPAMLAGFLDLSRSVLASMR